MGSFRVVLVGIATLATALVAASGADNALAVGDCLHDVDGNANNNTLNGTGNSDRMRGFGGADTLRGFGAGDCLFGGDGADNLDGGVGDDEITGGAQSDTIEARDGTADQIWCGDGANDVAWVDAIDVVAASCETANGPPPSPGPPAGTIVAEDEMEDPCPVDIWGNVDDGFHHWNDQIDCGDWETGPTDHQSVHVASGGYPLRSRDGQVHPGYRRQVLLETTVDGAQTLPTSSLNVVQAWNFPAPGTAALVDAQDGTIKKFDYTGKTFVSLTGVDWHDDPVSGTAADGDWVRVQSKSDADVGNPSTRAMLISNSNIDTFHPMETGHRYVWWLTVRFQDPTPLTSDANADDSMIWQIKNTGTCAEAPLEVGPVLSMSETENQIILKSSLGDNQTLRTPLSIGTRGVWQVYAFDVLYTKQTSTDPNDADQAAYKLWADQDGDSELDLVPVTGRMMGRPTAMGDTCIGKPSIGPYQPLRLPSVSRDYGVNQFVEVPVNDPW